MSEYTILVPSNLSSPPPASEYVEFYTQNSLKEKNTELVDTAYNPIVLEDISENLHSLMKNPFYQELCSVVVDELQQQLEKGYVLENMFNLKEYFGDMEEFTLRVDNIFKMLDFKPSVEVLIYLLSNYYNENYSATLPELSDSTNLKIQWFIDCAYSIYIIRKWGGSITGYRYLFSSIYHHGSVFLRAKYIETDAFSEYTNKYFKLTDFYATSEYQQLHPNSFNKLIPSSSTSKWPFSVNVSGVEDYFFAKAISYYQYDTPHMYDENIGEPSVLRYDTGIEIGYIGKGLILELCADKVFTHLNSLNKTKCLMDTMWMNHINSLLPLVKQVSAPVMLGTQLSLVANKEGTYISNPLVQIKDTVKYTHPNIEAKFQTIKTNWEANNVISYVQVGIGNLETLGVNVFADDTENPLTKTIPIALANPLFRNSIGTDEVVVFSGYQTCSVIIHPSTFTNQIFQHQAIKIAQSERPANIVESTIITFPHHSLTSGKSSFSFSLTFTGFGLETFERTIVFTDKFSTNLEKYITVPTLFDGDGNAIKDEYFYSPTDYLDAINYSFALDYFEFAEADLITIIPIAVEHVGEETETQIYSIIDNEKGTLTFKLQINPLSVLGKVSTYMGTGTLSLLTDISCSYTTNSIKRLNTSSFSDISSVVGITEIGVFNTDDNMVAYGTFPPIIYDAEKFHLSLNCLLENTV